MQRMKQLARTAVYWPNIDQDIGTLCRQCTACAEHQSQPPKLTNHPWMMPERPWSRLHVDHAINFMGSNWLVLVDAYSRYPCIQPTQSTSTKATTELLEESFAHFGYPHTLVTDNATTFTSEEFQEWCMKRGITHLRGAPYHPATNGAAERLVQSFKQALRKSALPPRLALLEFLQQYRRTPLATGYSPSELLHGRQIRTRIDAFLPSHAHLTQKKQTASSSPGEPSQSTHYSVGSHCYARCYAPKGGNPRWVPATVIKSGRRNITVRIHPGGAIWRRHMEQLRPRYSSWDDDSETTVTTDAAEPAAEPDRDDNMEAAQSEEQAEMDPEIPDTPAYGPGNPRRSMRTRRPVQRYGT